MDISEELRQKRREAGRKGGKKTAADGVKKGFALNPEFARQAQKLSIKAYKENRKK